MPRGLMLVIVGIGACLPLGPALGANKAKEVNAPFEYRSESQQRIWVLELNRGLIRVVHTKRSCTARDEAPEGCDVFFTENLDR